MVKFNNSITIFRPLHIKYQLLTGFSYLNWLWQKLLEWKINPVPTQLICFKRCQRIFSNLFKIVRLLLRTPIFVERNTDPNQLFH